MKSGYLFVETHAARPGLVRLVLSDESPDPAPWAHSDRRIRYIARFNDREAGLMHVHEILKRRLVDPDAHLYRVPPEQAVAAVESLNIRHRQVYLDVDFGDDARAGIARYREQFRANRRRMDQLFQTLGYLGLGLLLLNMLVLSAL